MKTNSAKRICHFKGCNKELVKGQREYCNKTHTLNCVYCNNEFTIDSRKHKANCSSKECVQKRKEETYMERFGVKNPYLKERTNLKTKVCEFPNCNKEFSYSGQKKYCSKQHKVNCEFCGDIFIVDSREFKKTNCSKQECIKKKREATCMTKYGVKNTYQSTEKKQKIAETNKQKYGAENPFASEEIKEKIRQHNIEKYGVDYYTQTKDFKEKSKETNLKKWGVEYASQSQEVKKKISCSHKGNIKKNIQ